MLFQPDVVSARKAARFINALHRSEQGIKTFGSSPCFRNHWKKARKYLSDLGVTVDEVRQVRLDSVGIMATPTLILADADSAVAESWQGKLPGEKESELLTELAKLK